MTREKMLEIEDKLYEAIRDKWGYGDEERQLAQLAIDNIHGLDYALAVLRGAQKVLTKPV